MFGLGQISRRGAVLAGAGLCMAALTGPVPAMAADVLFRAPEGCETYLSVQTRGCRVSHHYTCSAAPAGHQWRIDFGKEGPYFLSQIDAEGAWIHSVSLRSGVEERLQDGAADPASFSGLLATGTDTYDFRQTSNIPSDRRIAGFDTLTGRKVVIDGVELEETSFEYRESDGQDGAVGRAYGQEFIHRGWRLFFSGVGNWDDGSGPQPFDRSPMRFDEPGDAGFSSTRPEFDCDAQMAARDTSVKGRLAALSMNTFDRSLLASLAASPEE